MAFGTLEEAEKAWRELENAMDDYHTENYEPYRVEMSHTYGRDTYWVWCPARVNNPAGLKPPHPEWRPWFP